MKVYDQIFCTNEFQENPAWVALELSGCDEINIKLAQELISRDPQMCAVSFDMQGSYEFEGEYPLHDPILHISRDSHWVELTHRYGVNISIDLNDGASVQYVWNGKEVVEV